MTDFSKPQPQDPNDPSQQGNQAPQNQPPGGFPPPQQNQPPGAYGPPSSYGPPGNYGGYPPAPQMGYGAVPPGFTVDPGSGLMFPEGVELASRGRRIGAYFLGILLAIVTLGIGYLIWGLVVWGTGTSPALKVLKMKCYRPADGRVATFGTMALRDIVGGIVQSILSVITLLVSFIMFLATGKRQSLPDVIAGTVVVYDPNNVLG